MRLEDAATASVFPLDVEGADGLYAQDITPAQVTAFIERLQGARDQDMANGQGREHYSLEVLKVVDEVVCDQSGQPLEDAGDYNGRRRRLMGNLITAVMEQVLGLGKPQATSSSDSTPADS